MDTTITCPDCGATEGKVTIDSIATLTYVGRVAVEIDIDGDLRREHSTKPWEQKKVLVHDDRSTPHRELASFAIDGDPSDLELIDWERLEFDRPGVLIAFCWQCQSDVTEQFNALLDARVPLGVTA